MRTLALLPLAAALCACPNGNLKRTYPAPKTEDLILHVHGVPERARNLKAETKTDAWIGGERANVTVYMMAEWGGKLRFMAVQPNDSMAADLASDGQEYCLIDAIKNCGECGPATPENVGRLIRIVLQPDEVVAVLLGSTPLLGDAEAKVSWDSEDGREILELENADYKQRVELDGKDKRWDVLESHLTDKAGKTVFHIKHKDFHEVKSEGGEKIIRLPGASLFEQADDSVKIEWKTQEIDVDLPPAKFQITLQPGIPLCN
jgi:hypothetical protein